MKSIEQELQPYRDQIDDIDAQLVQLLGERNALVREIGEIKQDLDVPILDEGREEHILARIHELAEMHDIDSDVCRDIYQIIFAYSRSLQE